MPTFSTRQSGAIGEDLAEKYLKNLGYEILGRNMNCRYGEIDIVARRKQSLYFVEIKRRKGLSYGPAILSITEVKKQRLRKSAQYFLSHKPEWRNLIPFFSVIAIDEDPDNPSQPKIEFLPDAFV